MSTAAKAAVGITAVMALTAAAFSGIPRYAQWRDTANYRARLATALVDPTSAQFQAEKLVTNSNGSALCGNVNARNSFGGYVGYRAFVVTTDAVLFAPDGNDQDVESLKQQLNFLTVMRRHCFTEAEIAAAQAGTAN